MLLNTTRITCAAVVLFAGSAALLHAAEEQRTPTPEEFRELVKQYNQSRLSAPVQGVRQPNGLAQYNRAISLHAKKDATAAELKEAAKLYQEAVNAGITRAQVNLALLYIEGKGVKKDPKKALSLLNAAAKKGDPQADLTLARLYLSGKDVKLDTKKGEHHLTKAAKSGDQAAIKMLADYKDWKKKNELAMKEYQELIKKAQLNQALAKPGQLPPLTFPTKPKVTLQELRHPREAELQLPALPGYAFIGANPLFAKTDAAPQLAPTDKGVAAATTAQTPGETGVQQLPTVVGQ